MEISLPAPADFHVHLRQGEMSKLVAPHVRKGGFRLAYVMVQPFARRDVLPGLLITSSAQSEAPNYYYGPSISLQG